MIKTLKQAEEIAGTLSKPSKMPGYSYGLPAEACPVGSRLVNTPGSVCSDCYALKGRYVFPNVKLAQERRLRAIQHLSWVDAMVFMIGKRAIPYFRWHDSGDLQGMHHLLKIVEIAKRLPNISFWLPTREHDLLRRYDAAYGPMPANITVRVSATMIDGPSPTFSRHCTSGVVSSEEKSGNLCPAPKQGGECGSCRMCWDSSVTHVDYLRH